MRSEDVLRWVAAASLLLLAHGKAVAACPVYELRVANGLKEGQSLSVRLFSYRQPVRYDDEPMPGLQKYLAEELVNVLGKLQRFGSIGIITELEPAPTDLVLDGVLTEVDEGKLASGSKPPEPAHIHARGVVKRVASGEEILVFDCTRGITPHELSEVLPYPANVRLPASVPLQSGKTMIRALVKDIAEDMSGVVVASDRAPTRYHFEEEKLLGTNDSAWQSISVDWCPNGRFLAAAGNEGVVRIWNAQTRGVEAEVSEHSGTVFRVSWSPDGKRLASAGQDKTVRIWEWFEGEPITRLAVLGGHSGDVLSVAWSPDGKRLASAGKDQTVRLWEAVWEGRGTVLTGHKGAVYSVAWSPDGARLASSGEDGTIRLWDAVSAREQVVLRGHKGKVWDVAWSSDGTYLASSGEDGVLRVWVAATGQEERALKVDTRVSGAVSWSPDGSRLLTVERNLVRLWDAGSGNEIRTVIMYPCPEKQRVVLTFTRDVSCMGRTSLSPDGTRLAVAGPLTLVRQLYDTGSP